MKKYNKPTIDALALETIDVIAASGTRAAVNALAEEYDIDPETVQAIHKNVADMRKGYWSW